MEDLDVRDLIAAGFFAYALKAVAISLSNLKAFVLTLTQARA
jgi:hypothetical protein